jgi:ABC-2 type transport system permease protein
VSAPLAPPASAPPLRRSYSGELSACAALFGLTLRQYTHGRRLLVVALLYALPVGLAVLLRSLPNPAPPDILEVALIFHLLPHGLAPFTALLYAAGIVQDEVEEQTLTYLLMRSVPRRALYVTKLLPTLCLTALLVAVAAVALYAASFWGTPEFGEVMTTRAPRAAAVMALAQVGYCTLFGLLGLITRRPLIAGVAYIVVVEGVLANLNFVGRTLTVVYYVRTLIVRWLPFPQETLERKLKEWDLDLTTAPSVRRCLVALLGAGVAVAALSALEFARREFRMKTPEGS